MKEASKIIMGATLIMVVSLAVVLALILVLLAELYCSLLLRSRRRRNNSSPTPATPTTTKPTSTSLTNQLSASPLSSIYSHGVLRAPPNFLFPTIPRQPNMLLRQQYLSFSHTAHQSSSSTTSPRSPRRIGYPSPESPLPPLEIEIQVSPSSCTHTSKDSFMYISNPIFDNHAAVTKTGAAETPFETPETSPSRLESGGSSSGDEYQSNSPILTTPLTPMKKLPEEACSVSLRDARSLGTSVTDSNSRNVDSSSSSVSSSSWY